MTTDTGCSLARPIEPVFEYGFWWWYDATRKGWFVGTAPQIQRPTWNAPDETVSEHAINGPTDMVEVYVHSGQYLIVREVVPSDV